jgi:hypothetical protein
MIRRQARFLGKPVRALADRTRRQISRKAPKEGKFRGSAWNKSATLCVYPTPSALSLRCKADRSMPTNSAVREILPENRLIWAIR